ncbi:MAG: SagB/ThcOx family dehydrogenase [Bacteroidetes bacterium]|nr:SagB/ThcOx family dehydrogenase [Bacteroidota bacterium]
MKAFISVFLSVLFMSSGTYAQKFEKINLNEPELNTGKLLMQALKDRKSDRVFSDKELSLQELSNLLWAADGFNRPEEGKRTAPSAMNKQEIDIYVILKNGIYLYDAKEKALLPVAEGDFRKEAGKQDFVATAPVNLVFVADLNKLGKDKKVEDTYSGVNVGFISQNVYLYCASADLATVARGSVDKEGLSKTLQLKPGQVVILGQTIGYRPEK